MKKKFLCFALAAMLLCGSVVMTTPVYAAGGSNTTITLTKDADAPYTGREYTAPMDKTAVSDITLPDGWSWLDPDQTLTTEFANLLIQYCNLSFNLCYLCFCQIDLAFTFFGDVISIICRSH